MLYYILGGYVLAITLLLIRVHRLRSPDSPARRKADRRRPHRFPRFTLWSTLFLVLIGGIGAGGWATYAVCLQAGFFDVQINMCPRRTPPANFANWSVDVVASRDGSGSRSVGALAAPANEAR